VYCTATPLSALKAREAFTVIGVRQSLKFAHASVRDLELERRFTRAVTQSTAQDPHGRSTTVERQGAVAIDGSLWQRTTTSARKIDRSSRFFVARRLQRWQQ
jgi:hypothetical protein